MIIANLNDMARNLNPRYNYPNKALDEVIRTGSESKPLTLMWKEDDIKPIFIFVVHLFIESNLYMVLDPPGFTKQIPYLV